MKKSTDIAKLIAEKKAVMQAVVEMATKEARELTAEEKTQIDAINGLADKPGELQQLQEDYDRAVRFEARVSEIATEIGNRKPQERPAPKAVVVPARAKARHELKAFTKEEDAYKAGQFFAATLYDNPRAKAWCKEHGVATNRREMRNAMSEGDNSRGGLFVPIEAETAIIRLVEKFGKFRQYAKKEPMGSNVKTVPVRVAGMTAYPVAGTNTANESTNTGTQSEPQWTNIELVARKWKTWLKFSDELNEDSIVSMADQIAMESALAFAYAEDNSGFNGDGISTYHGITGLKNILAAGSIHTCLAGNLAFSTLDLADFQTALGKLPDYENMQPAWFISKRGYYDSMDKLKLGASGNDAANIAAGAPPMFLGLPVVWSQVLNATLTDQASTILAYVGDLNMAALFGDRRGMTMSLTDQRYWDTDQIAVKATERFDINIHSKGTAAAAGAMIAIKTPAS